MSKTKLVAPVLKWVGGKRQILGEIKRYIPKTFETYYEPFLGGGAVLFELQPKNASVNDINSELMNVYVVIRDNVEDLIESLKQHGKAYKHNKKAKEYFYKIRELDRDKEIYDKLTSIEKAARVIFLNKTCYNGLFRVNRAGQFNTPFGYHKNPSIVNAQTLRAVSDYFNSADIRFSCDDFETALEDATEGDFVYLDPPYDPVSDTASFTGYDRGGFDKSEQARLGQVCHKLNEKGVKFVLSNSATDFIMDLYKDYIIEVIQARRVVNSRADRRGDVDEVMVRNFERQW